MARDKSYLPENSADALRARAARVYHFAWDFPYETAKFLEFAAELEAMADALNRAEGLSPSTA